jgi:hypothetical protein
MVVWETAKSSRHFRIVEPDLPERIISPAILRAKTSDAGNRHGSGLGIHIKGLVKLYRFSQNYTMKINATPPQ